MSTFNDTRKNSYKKGTDYSRYNEQGLVTYSESIGYRGDTVRHYYDYDAQGRRIQYIERIYEPNIDTGDLDDLVILEEHTIYYDNGDRYIQNANFDTGILTQKYINSMGRELKIKSFDMTTGYGTVMTYNSYRDCYDIKNIIEVFIPYALSIKWEIEHASEKFN